MHVFLFIIIFFKSIFKEYHQVVKQFGSRSDPTFCQTWSGSKLIANVISRRQKSPLAGKELMNPASSKLFKMRRLSMQEGCKQTEKVLTRLLVWAFFVLQGQRKRRRVSYVTRASCIWRHQGIQLRLAYNWVRPAIVVAGKGREEIFLFLHFLHFHLFPLSPLSLSPISSTISSISLLPFSGRRHKMTHKGWCAVKPQHNQNLLNWLNLPVSWAGMRPSVPKRYTPALRRCLQLNWSEIVGGICQL